MSEIFQITEEDVELSSTLEKKDIGLYCIIANGSIVGFKETIEEIIKLRKEIS